MKTSIFKTETAFLQCQTLSFRGRSGLLRQMRRLGTHIFLPALPILLSLCFSAFIAISDGYLAAKMSTTDLAAMGFCEPLWFLIALLTTGLSAGISVGFAQKHTEQKNAQCFLVDSLITSCFLGLTLVVLALSLSSLLKLDPHWLSNTSLLVSKYFSICAFSNLPFALMQAQCAVFRSSGNGRHVLLIWGTAAILEIALSNFFVACGWLSLCAMATSWLFACLIASILGLFLLAPLLRSFAVRQYLRTGWKVHADNAALVLRIGLPIALSELGLICGSFLNLQIIATLPDAQILEGAWAIKSRLEEALEIVPICAVALVVSPFVSRYWSRHSARSALWAARLASHAALFGGLILCAIAFITRLGVSSLVSYFGCDTALTEQAVHAVSIGCLAWPFFAVSQILFAAMEGTGKTLLPTLSNLICVLPIRYVLSSCFKNLPHTNGMTGILMSGVIAQLIFVFAMVLLYRQYCAQRPSQLHGR